MRKILGCFIFFMLMMASQIFAGTVYYVDASRPDDSGNGESPATAWKTISKVQSTLTGDQSDTVVKFKCGETWTETYTVAGYGTPGHQFVHTSYGSGDKPVIDGELIRDFCINTASKDYITIEGFELKDASAGRANIRNVRSTGIIIKNCDVYNPEARGIYFYDCSNCTIENNLIDTTAVNNGYQNDCIYLENGSGGHTISGNTIYMRKDGFYIDGIQTYQEAGTNTITSNWIEFMDGYTTGAGSMCVNLEASTGTWNVHYNVLVKGNADTGAALILVNANSGTHNIYNNIIMHKSTGSGPVDIINMTTGFKFRNNIFYSSNGRCFRSETGISSPSSLDYNCYYRETGTEIGHDGNSKTWAQWQSAGYEPYGKNADPKFVDKANNDYHLASDSPCIDAGDPYTIIDMGFTQDYAGTSVPVGNGIDIGPYEYVGENPPLSVNVSGFPTSGEVPLTVNFTGNASGGTQPYTYSWDFGDGTFSSEQNPSHTYNDADDYTATLTVTDGDSNQDFDSLIINVSAIIIPLEASFIASPTSGEVPLTVNFTGSATGGTQPYTYSWNFGDGTSSSEQNPSHTYNDPGDFTVTLTVTDSLSNQDSDSLIINVSATATPLEASCNASPISGEAPLTVNFTGSATGGVLPYSYSWDFGDSTSSSEQNPSHTYNNPGDFTVTLTVTDSDSNQDSDSLTINASAPTTPLEVSCNASSTSGEAPLTVNFTGSATGGVLPYSYSWDFGDGTSSSEQNPSHTYSEAGDYVVTFIVTDGENTQNSDSLTINVFVAEAYISCTPKNLYIGASASGYETTAQNLRIINAGRGKLTWNIEDDKDWLSSSPSSGLGRRKIAVSANASGLALGLYTATITVSSPEAYNSPQYVSVNLRVYEAGDDSSPFGYFDTPVDGSVVEGCVPVTGWALDDIEVTRVEIKRNSDPEDLPEAIGPDGLVYIGDAVFVEGARPDVEDSYPDYPLSSRAGWGYTLLTNDLPNGGNGSFTIYSFAYDASGHRVEIGRKTILCDNANSTKPFGTIDTPEQGEIISGSDYINFGWALTPLPKTIPKDGTTIWVWVDGVQVGHPVYNQFREDIATSFPEYNNAQGAVGYYHLDITQYENGVHTVAWTVMDDEGEADGIGSRYFSVDNIETANASQGYFGLKSIYREDTEGRLSVGLKEFTREYGPRVDSDRVMDPESILNIQIEEMEPLRLVLEESSSVYMEYIGWAESESRFLPIGSTFDREKGIFSWIPTPGFIGRYVLYFAVTDGLYMSKPVQVVVNVIPKSYD